MESNVKDHYNSDNLTKKIQSALIENDKNLSELTLRDLSPIDQLHTGGAKASIDLLKKINLSRHDKILDAGCGIGGSARLMAKQFGCRVFGIDLADQFIEAALFLTRSTRLEPQISFQQGSVLELPYEDNTFDTILCQHILMNIKDKSRTFKEFFRVLTPGGQLLLHEISKGINDDMSYPVPWAFGPSISFLEPWEATAVQINKTGFTPISIIDNTDFASGWWKKIKSIPRSESRRPNALNPGLIFGKNAAFFGENMFANFKNNSICLIEAIFKKG
ncbi:MAG: class I SAM-dependent methyltransferase [Desulfobacula sp.]|nr:class I SAM-dependent methyltransferase [Desulfobacula sp.]